VSGGITTLVLRRVIDDAGVSSQVGVGVLERLLRTRTDVKAVVNSDQRIPSGIPRQLNLSIAEDKVRLPSA